MALPAFSQPVPPRVPVRERVVVLGGVRTRALEVDGDGPPVLLLHGFSDSADGWRALLAAFAARGRTAVAVDLPGHGRAARPRPDRPLVPQLVEFAAAAAGWTGERPVVVGNSLGGLVALLLAAQDRMALTGVVPVSPAGFDYAVWLRLVIRPMQLPLVPALVDGAHALLPRAVVRAVLRSVVPLVSGAPDAALWPHATGFADTYARHLAGRGARRCLLDMLARLAREAVDVPLQLQDVPCPVLLLWGDRDPVTPVTGAGRAVAALPGVRCEVLPGAGHLPQLQRPDRIAELVFELAPASPDEEIAPAG